MGLLDAIVDRSFRETTAGRAVVFSVDLREPGYLLKTTVEEQKVRSFLKLFYFAQFYVLVFGALLSQICASWLIEASFDRPAQHMLGAMGISLLTYITVVGLPYLFLWRTYKRTLTSFTDTAEAVSLAGASAPSRSWILLAVFGFAILLLGAVLILTMRPAIH